ncbi:MAG: hypothetical protein AOA65_1115 [Candidatus Bathyarchaeota archaeon BA1]|nr:MAG: hypothetical protein AOA65_1115 [Candidatus Bathyarchaeota archaeon BA1]
MASRRRRKSVKKAGKNVEEKTQVHFSRMIVVKVDPRSTSKIYRHEVSDRNYYTSLNNGKRLIGDGVAL